eukprot:4952722-Pyramimonas_sp.AAC.1
MTDHLRPRVHRHAKSPPTIASASAPPSPSRRIDKRSHAASAPASSLQEVGKYAAIALATFPAIEETSAQHRELKA